MAKAQSTTRATAMPPAGVRARTDPSTDPSTVHQEALRGSLSVTAERLVRLLGAELSLCGNRGDAPSSRQHQYQPLVFGREVPFFHELFCRGLNLLAKTRREMRAKTQHDQDKVGMGRHGHHRGGPAAAHQCVPLG